MMRWFHLVDMAHIPTPSHSTYSPEQMEAARAVMVNRRLRFDDLLGVLYDDNGWLSRPSGYDHAPQGDAAEVLRWEFLPRIANSASRVARGYSP